MMVNNYHSHIKRYFQIILVILIFAGFSSCRYIKQQLYFRKHSLKAAIEWAKQDSTRVADSLKKIMLDKKNFDRTLADSVTGEDENNLSVGDTTPRYYIIIGTFANHVNAEKAAGQYSGQGYKTEIITVTNKDGTMLDIVSVKTFSDFKEAGIFLKDFQVKHDPGAWVYTRK
jgi:hypothetical protein